MKKHSYTLPFRDGGRFMNRPYGDRILPDKPQFESLSQTYKNDPTEKLPSGRFIFTYSFTLYAHHAPLVKSGKATGIPPLAMDSSERAVTAIQAAPS